MTTELARLQNFGPNWFASVMGTGIVATAGVTLPVHAPGVRVFSNVVWVAAAVLLVQTTRGSFGGSLFAPPPTAGPIKAVKDPPK